MSDRFYKQMSEHYNMPMWQLSAALRDKNEDYKLLEKKSMGKSKKVTRKDISNEIGEILGEEIALGKLPLLTLEVMLKKLKSGEITPPSEELPSGRLKAPYIRAVQDSLGVEVDLTAATVSVLSTFLTAVTKRNEND